MIEIRFEEREKIGLQYILESLHGCSPFGQERIRRLRYYTPDQRQELELELYNVERAAAHAEELKDLYDQICVVLCQMKDIRGSLRRCRELEVPDHVELFELKGYLQRLETLRRSDGGRNANGGGADCPSNTSCRTTMCLAKSPAWPRRWSAL